MGQTHTPEGAYDNYLPMRMSLSARPWLLKQMPCTRASKTGRQMLRAIALHLELDEAYFEQYVPGGNSILRLIHTRPSRQNLIQAFAPASTKTSTSSRCSWAHLQTDWKS